MLDTFTIGWTAYFIRGTAFFSTWIFYTFTFEANFSFSTWGSVTACGLASPFDTNTGSWTLGIIFTDKNSFTLSIFTFLTIRAFDTLARIRNTFTVFTNTTIFARNRSGAWICFTLTIYTNFAGGAFFGFARISLASSINTSFSIGTIDSCTRRSALSCSAKFTLRTSNRSTGIYLATTIDT